MVISDLAKVTSGISDMLKESNELWDSLSLRERQILTDQGINKQEYFRLTKEGRNANTQKSPLFNRGILNARLDAGEEGLRKSRNLHHQKQNKIKVADSLPPIYEGADGDLVIVNTSKGPALYTKISNNWHNLTGTVSISSGGTVSSDVRNTYGRSSEGSTAAIDYDSGWVAANSNTTVTIAHNLALTDLPSRLSVYASDNSNPVIGTNTILKMETLNDDDGLLIEIKDANNLEVHVGDGKLYNDEGFGNSRVPSDFTNGYIRILIQK